MFDVLSDLNWLAIVLASVASIVIAAVYYVVLTPRHYAIALGRENATETPQSLTRNVGPIVCIVVTTITSAVLVETIDITSLGDALTFGAVVGIGYLTAMTFQIALNPNFPRPIYYGVVNAPFFIVTSLLSSVILVALR